MRRWPKLDTELTLIRNPATKRSRVQRHFAVCVYWILNELLLRCGAIRRSVLKIGRVRSNTSLTQRADVLILWLCARKACKKRWKVTPPSDSLQNLQNALTEGGDTDILVCLHTKAKVLKQGWRSFFTTMYIFIAEEFELKSCLIHRILRASLIFLSTSITKNY